MDKKNLELTKLLYELSSADAFCYTKNFMTKQARKLLIAWASDKSVDHGPRFHQFASNFCVITRSNL